MKIVAVVGVEESKILDVIYIFEPSGLPNSFLTEHDTAKQISELLQEHN